MISILQICLQDFGLTPEQIRMGALRLSRCMDNEEEFVLLVARLSSWSCLSPLCMVFNHQIRLTIKNKLWKDLYNIVKNSVINLPKDIVETELTLFRELVALALQDITFFTSKEVKKIQIDMNLSRPIYWLIPIVLDIDGQNIFFKPTSMVKLLYHKDPKRILPSSVYKNCVEYYQYPIQCYSHYLKWLKDCR